LNEHFCLIKQDKVPVIASTLFFLLPFLVLYTILVVYAERKLSAFMQDRLGPMEVGYYGLLQTVADLLKLLQKEDLTPQGADRWLFKAAPLLIFLAVFAGFALLPLAPAWPGSSLPSGIFLLLAIISLDVIGIVLAGWASNNKYSMMGTVRSAAQIISYEVPLGLAVACVCLYAGTLNLQEISWQQSAWAEPAGPKNFLGIPGLDARQAGGFLVWNVFTMPVLWVAWLIFFIASLAESNRAPFDLPEAESELVAGFQTEYSGFRWAVIMLAEYAMMLLVSLVGVILFFGSWTTPLPNLGPVRLADWTSGTVGHGSATAWGIFWLMGKAVLMVCFQIWVRWTFPRVRIDQLVSLCWKYLTPFSLVCLLLVAVWKLL
jgi:NADH-quinone oxidoreductase subunit H